MNDNGNGKRAILYARCSRDDRDTDGRNLASQLEMGRQRAAERGYTVVAEIAEDDRGTSGASFELDGLNRILEMAQRGEFDVLVPRELDRLSRNLAKQLIVEEELRRHGVVIDYVLGEYADTPEGRLDKHIRATIAEVEREKISERMSRGRRDVVRSGSVIVNGRPPYGYSVEKDGKRVALVVNEAEAAVVRLIFRLYTEGDGERGPLSVYRIRQDLEGVPTYSDTHGGKKQREAGKWSCVAIHGMLRNETYIGRWHYGKMNLVNGKWVANPDDHRLAVDVPAIVEIETWEAVQARHAEQLQNARRNRKHNYLLARRATCGCCNYKMGSETRNGGRNRYYVCPARRANHQLARSCDAPLFNAELADELAWGWVQELLAGPDALERGLRKHNAQQERENAPILARLKVTDDLLSENQAQMEALIDLCRRRVINPEQLVDRKGRLDQTIIGLEKERANLVARLQAGAVTAAQIATLTGFVQKTSAGIDLANADLTTRREIIEALNIQASFYVQDGAKKMRVSCLWTEQVFEFP